MESKRAVNGDEDAIHDLRVSIRRFSQGLILFPEFFAEHRIDKIRKQLKGLMRLTSEVRNRDIAMEYLKESTDSKLLERLRLERTGYAAQFNRRISKLLAKDFAAGWSQLSVDDDTHQWNPSLSVSANAKQALPAMAAAYFQAGRESVGEEKARSPKELHRFRVRTKRFRYALEMFRPAYGRAIEERLARLQNLQRILGKISDVYTIRDLLKNDGDHKRALARDGQKRIEEFRKHWTTDFDAPGQEKAWMRALRRTV